MMSQEATAGITALAACALALLSVLHHVPLRAIPHGHMAWPTLYLQNKQYKQQKTQFTSQRHL